MSQSVDARAQFLRLLEDLRASPSGEVRVQLAEQIGHAYANHELTNYERSLAYEICEACAADLEIKVRASLAQQLCASPLLPRGLAMRLAEDVHDVAGPVLLYSQVLTDTDLLAIIETASQDKLLAISQREKLSAKVGHELIDRGDARVVWSVLVNPGSNLEERSLGRALNRYPHDEIIHKALVERPHLPASVAAKLIGRISDELVKRVVAREDFQAQLVFDIAQRAEEAVIVGLQDEQVESLVNALHAQGKLTPMLLLRAIATRQRSFFTCAMARLACLPADEVEELLYEGEAHKRSDLYKQAGFPSSLFSAFNAVLSILRDTEDSGTQPDPETFEKKIVFRLAQAYRTVSPTNIDQALFQIEKSVFRHNRPVSE